MSPETKDQIKRFVADLKRQIPAISWAEVSERVQQNFPDAGGVSLTANALRKRYRVDVKKSERSQSYEIPTVAVSIDEQVKEGLHKALPERIKHDLEGYVSEVVERVVPEVVQRVIEEKISNLVNDSTARATQSLEYPPAPALPETISGTRKHMVPRGKLSGTVDSTLLQLFEGERRERGYNVSRMLDVALWNYFGFGRPERPQLSFELSESSEATGDG